MRGVRNKFIYYCIFGGLFIYMTLHLVQNYTTKSTPDPNSDTSSPSPPSGREQRIALLRQAELRSEENDGIDQNEENKDLDEDKEFLVKNEVEYEDKGDDEEDDVQKEDEEKEDEGEINDDKHHGDDNNENEDDVRHDDNEENEDNTENDNNDDEDNTNAEDDNEGDEEKNDGGNDEPLKELTRGNKKRARRRRYKDEMKEEEEEDEEDEEARFLEKKRDDDENDDNNDDGGKEEKEERDEEEKEEEEAELEARFMEKEKDDDKEEEKNNDQNKIKAFFERVKDKFQRDAGGLGNKNGLPMVKWDHEQVENMFSVNVEDKKHSLDYPVGNILPDFTKYTLRTSPWIEPVDDDGTPAVTHGTKYVALYVDPERRTSDYRNNKFATCKYSNCEFTTDFSTADAVVVLGRSLKYRPLQRMWKRPPYQRWVLKTVDPVIHDFGLDNDTLRSLFNWTSTYKMDTDIPGYLGCLQRRETKLPVRDYVSIFRQKTKVAAWFVSHCDTWSKREEYVERMATVAPVDIFGRCGPYKCGGNHDRGKYDGPMCFPILTKTYKFYLAFENAFCVDYITEKFFKMFVDVQVIPVVRGSVDYNNAFPRGTFVNANDFDTPESLMRYLVKLGNDEEAYIKMLKAKDKWENCPVAKISFWCNLCRKLHTNNTLSHYRDIHRELNKDRHECWAPKDLGPKYDHVDIKTIIEEKPKPRR